MKVTPYFTPGLQGLHSLRFGVTVYTIALPTRAILMLNVLGKRNVLGEAMQPFVHHQHDGVVKIKYREDLRFFVMLDLCIVIITVLYVNAMGRDVVIANQVGFLELFL